MDINPIFILQEKNWNDRAHQAKIVLLANAIKEKPKLIHKMPYYHQKHINYISHIYPQFIPQIKDLAEEKNDNIEKMEFTGDIYRKIEGLKYNTDIKGKDMIYCTLNSLGDELYIYLRESDKYEEINRIYQILNRDSIGAGKIMGNEYYLCKFLKSLCEIYISLYSQEREIMLNKDNMNLGFLCIKYLTLYPVSLIVYIYI